MKYIQKHGQPHAYTSWRNQVKGTAKNNYTELPTALKQSLLAALLAEQGFICAYTMKRVALNTSHIEHIKPETICRAELAGSDLDYENLVACFPRADMGRRYRYGAQ